MTPTPREQIDKIVDELYRAKDRWVKVDVPTRLRLLHECIEATLKNAKSFAEASCQNKEIDFNSSTSSEEWLAGPVCILRNLHLLINTLEQILRHGSPVLKKNAFGKSPAGQVVARVFPQNIYDKLLYTGFSAQVWMEPGQTEASTKEGMGWVYKSTWHEPGKVALVLGAGNVSSIGPLDVIYKLFVENQVCVLKMNPVNEYTGPFVEASLKPLVDEGFMRLVYGGGDVGAYLVDHPNIDEIHITGSDKVHDIIVWGADSENAKKTGTPRLKKRITSELGCVTPVMITPGEWTEKELDFQAQNVATMIVNNGSFNCNAAKLIITSKSWAQREVFLKKLQDILATIPQRFTYYPGSDQKYSHFLENHPDAKAMGERQPNKIRWTTIFGVDSKKTNDIVFKKEAWCGVVAETSLDTNNAEEFLTKAPEFCNQHVWGTLSCVLLIDPRTQKKNANKLEEAIQTLKYGSIAINHWAALSYAFGVTTWGAHPGHTLADIQSGIGVVHNTIMFRNPQKSVVRGPFVFSPLPPWFATHKNAHKVAQKLVSFEANPSLFKLPGILMAAIKG